MAADRILPEILTEILSRLPVQSLLRFRSTSNSLRSLIDSHNFINLQLKNSLNRSLIIRQNSYIYQLQIDDNPTKPMIQLNHPFTLNSTNIDRFTRNSTVSLIDSGNGLLVISYGQVAFTRPNSTVSLIGSCNGLLAISYGKIAFLHPNATIEITFWNPNTRKHQIIPFLSLPIPNIMESEALWVHGFGFDSLTGDYKLLRISWFATLQNPFYGSQITLFSSKRNSWKVISTMPYALQYAQTTGVFVENSLHWIMAKKLDGLHPSLIVAFNLTLETFNEVPLPAEIGGEDSFQFDVAVLGGCLCLSVNYETTKIDVWVMKEYGSRDSWVKLFTLVKTHFTSSLKSSRPLGYSCDGSKVLLEGIQVLLEVSHRRLFWYDLNTEQVSFVEGIPNLNEAMICVESLVPPSFPIDNCRKENQTSKGKRRLFHSAAVWYLGMKEKTIVV